MVTLYIDGQKLGSWAEAEKQFADAAKTKAVEFRDDHGRVIATSIPGCEPVLPWEANITPAETDRRMAGEFVTFDELKRRLGWE